MSMAMLLDDGDSVDDDGGLSPVEMLIVSDFSLCFSYSTNSVQIPYWFLLKSPFQMRSNRILALKCSCLYVLYILLYNTWSIRRSECECVWQFGHTHKHSLQNSSASSSSLSFYFIFGRCVLVRACYTVSMCVAVASLFVDTHFPTRNNMIMFV